MNRDYILGIDCGTSLVKVMIVDRNGRPVSFSSSALITLTPREGRVEQNPEEMWRTVIKTVNDALKSGNIGSEKIAAIGITNQRETTVVWNKITGRPYGNAVVWLDKRTESMCGPESEKLGPVAVIRTGMFTIPNTSAMLLTWLLRNDRQVIEGVEKGEAVFGTVNSWLLWKLTGGNEHCTDVSNMSVTQLQNAVTLDYDPGSLDVLGIPRVILPEIKGTGEVFGYTDKDIFSGHSIPVAGMLGDQMAAMLGEGCVRKGMAKVTYGTGCFAVMNTGDGYTPPGENIFSPVLWGGRSGRIYGLEGFCEIYGDHRSDEVIAETVGKATGIIRRMEKLSGRKVGILRVDGGMSKSDDLCQLQADNLNIPVERSAVSEATVLGAVYQAGITVGFWSSVEETASLWEPERRFDPV